jgi:hypothetical protein
MPVPIVYRSGGEATASYDWVDYVSGCGYRSFYGAAGATTGPAYTYFLTTNSNIDSTTNRFYADGTTDLDFDITFKNYASISGGDAFVNYTMYLSNGSTGHVTIKIYHVTAGGAETSLGTAECPLHTAAGNSYFRDCHNITLTAKNFVPGDKLRLNVITTDHGGGITVRTYFDPASGLNAADTATRTVGTDMVLLLPFKIDV